MAINTHNFYHPFLFGLICTLAIVELGLTSYERKQQTDWPIGGANCDAVTSRINYLIFCSAWTTVTGLCYAFLANTTKFGLIASYAAHTFWLTITWIMWLIAAALYQQRLIKDGCGQTERRCHINHTVEGFAWMEMILTFLTIWMIVFNIGKKTERYKTGPYDA